MPWTDVTEDLSRKGIVGTSNQTDFTVKKTIKGKGDKLYLKWKGYDNSFNSWIDKKDIAI